MPRLTPLTEDSPFHDPRYSIAGTEDYTQFHAPEPEIDDQGRVAFQDFTIHTRTLPVTLEMKAVDFISLSEHHRSTLLRFFNLKLTGKNRAGNVMNWNFGRDTRSEDEAATILEDGMDPDLHALGESRSRRMIPTMLLRAMNIIDHRERSGDVDPLRRHPEHVRDELAAAARREEAAARAAATEVIAPEPGVIEDLLRPVRSPAEAAAGSLSPSTGLLNSINEAMASIGDTFREVANSASAAATTARRSGGARIPEYATYDRSRRLVNQPMHFGRVADRAQWTRFLGRLNRYGTTHAREAGLVTSIYEGTSGQQNSPLVRAWERTGRGMARMLRQNGLELDESVTIAITKVIAAHAAGEVAEARTRASRANENLTAVNRRVRELENELAEARRTPQASAEETQKAARWDEARQVAVEWNEAPSDDARGKLNAFRKLHHLLTTIAEEAAPATTDDAPDTPAA